MQILTSTLLAAALLAGQTLAADLLATQGDPNCGVGLSLGTKDYTLNVFCNLNKQNVYFCGDTGASVVHKQSRIILRAGKVDSTVLVECGPHGESGTIYHCKAGHWERFSEPVCKEGQITSVQSVHEIH
ncbi:hypothetical protein EsDP_00001895 [Epichloe bromicola]|uniref:Cyanovirin-N domain-containing protein n=1 Tax=Epichloe bromicola TaxID=79588 RepID=A0ABQ0CJ63_9HYPO